MKLVAFLNLFWVLVGYYLLKPNYAFDMWNLTQLYRLFLLILPFLLFFLLHPNLRKLLKENKVYDLSDLNRIEGDAVYFFTDDERRFHNEGGFFSILAKEGQPKDVGQREGMILYNINFLGILIFGFLSYEVLVTGLQGASNADLFYLGSCILSLINFLGIQFAWSSKPQT